MTIVSIWLVLVLAALAVVSAAAGVVRAAGRQWLRAWIERQLGGSAAGTAKLVRPHRLLLGAAAAAALLLSVAGVLVGTAAIAPAAVVAASLVFSLVALVLGHAVPRALGLAWAARLEPVSIPFLRLTTRALQPAMATAALLARPVGGTALDHRPHTEREEIEELLREAELEGIGEPEELALISGVVQFGDRQVGEVMTPRTSVYALDVETPPRELALGVAQSGYSRVPVYRQSLDEVVGMVHVFDVLETRGERMPAIRQVKIAPESKPCREMLFEMLREQQHLAVILDEFGGTAGIVTLEDLLEEIVGDIRDEHDEPAAPEARRGSRALVVEGTTELRELARRLNLPAADDEAGATQTLNGALMRGLGRIPTVGERFQLGELEVTVVEAEPTRVTRALVQRAGAEPAPIVRLAG